MSILSQRRKLIEAERAKKLALKKKAVPSTQRTAADVAEAEEYLKKLSKEFGEQNAKMNETLDPVKGTYIPSLKAAGDHKQNPMDRIQDADGAKKLVAQDEAELRAEELAKQEEEALKAADKAEEELPGKHEPEFEKEAGMTAEEASANLVSMTQDNVAKIAKENAAIDEAQTKRKPKKKTKKVAAEKESKEELDK